MGMERTTAITRTSFNRAKGGQPQLGKTTKADIKNFADLTQFIIGKVGVEPQWELTIEVDPELADGENLAMIHFDSTYMTAHMRVHPINVVERERWVTVLLHELAHLLIADLDELSQPKYDSLQSVHRVASERSVSMVERVLHQTFRDAYLKEYKGWL